MQVEPCSAGAVDDKPSLMEQRGADASERLGGAAPREGMKQILIEGQRVQVPVAEIDGLPVICRGGRIKIASIHDEEFLNGDLVPDPDAMAKKIKATHLGADLFTFSQKVPDSVPKFSYYREWENMAVIPITTYSDWLENRVTYDVRKAVRRSHRMGVEIRKAAFDDAFVQGICNIYNESPVRQGKAFWHYHKDPARVREEQGAYLDRCCFIGAYLDGELIGFIRMIYVNGYAASMQVLSEIRHRREKTSNALIAKVVEICVEEGLSHFVYGRYIYYDPASSLTEFKRRNGFEPMFVPRYYIPLTAKGALALKLRLHWSPMQHVPMSWRPPLYRLRGWLSARKP